MLRHCNRTSRRGMILLIVVSFLALALSMGLAFVYYANHQAMTMRFYREAAQGGRSARVNQYSRGYTDEAPPQAYDIASAALGQLIYDNPDNDSGIYSALRGGSLARSMYGQYYNGTPQTPHYRSNDRPFNGIGRCRASGQESAPGLIASVGDGDFRAVNYTYFPQDGFLRDPERVGYRLSDHASLWIVEGLFSDNNYFPLNAGYTYPDEKDIYLAAIRPSDGCVLVPSFYRPSTFGALSPDNPNWTNRVGKYLIHRPRPIDMGPGFPAVPANADGTYTGDVEQLEGKQVRRNDSLWLDIDLPVHKWRGRQYKPLVAFLIADLDGRINANVAGNRRGLGNRNASNQGWGAWEMDVQPLLVFDQGSSLFLNPKGRYGSDNEPNAPYSVTGQPTGDLASPAPRNPFYAQTDFDGSMLTHPGIQPRMQLPQAPSTRTSPTYPPRFGGGDRAERSNHPLLYNPYLLPASPSNPAPDRKFSVNDLLLLNRAFNGDDSHYAQAQLAQILPRDMGRSCTPGSNGWPAAAANPRYLVTTHSSDLDRPGMTPWLLNSGTNYASSQTLGASGVYQPAPQPSGPAVNYPGLIQRLNSHASPNTINDFDPLTWKSEQSVLGGIDLNRPLADYRNNPGEAYEEAGNVTAASARRAIMDRQQVAMEIFNRLCVAAGAQIAVCVRDTPEFDAVRYLAQLSANIVDFIDGDDYVTPFVWNPIDPADPQNPANFSPTELPNRVVFGVELPRLVINEALVRVENGAAVPGLPDTDPGLVPHLGALPHATFYDVKVWAELINPLTPGRSSTANLSHNGGAPLKFEGNQVYRMLLTSPNRKLRTAANVKGDPDGTVHQTADLPEGVYAPVKGVIPVSNGAYIQPRSPNSSFYVVGCEPLPGDLLMPSAVTGQMKYRIPATGYGNGDAARTCLMLQRLACPHLPPGDTNPYVTVDYMDFDRHMIADGRVFDSGGLIVPPPPGLLLQSSWGRMQPYAGDASQVVPQAVVPAPVAGLSQTFFRHNGQGNLITNAGLTLTQPFDWLVHLDRELVSPIELFNVSAYKPHELTQQFVIGRGDHEKKFRHLADWKSDGARLYRALAMLETKSRVIGSPVGGRKAGAININTIWDEAIFASMCAANSANNFTAADVRAVWQKLAASRTPSGAPSANLGQDRPFQTFDIPIVPAGDSQFPRGSGIADTLLRPDAQDPARCVLDIANQKNPYLQHELLNKISGNLTTRSNVFAVWMTVGYFEVVDAAARPVKLGPELGLVDGTNIRHHFFAIIDRTNLAIDPANPRFQGPRPVFFSYEPSPIAPGVDPPTPGTVTATIPAQGFDGTCLRGTYDDSAWELRTGNQLTVDTGSAQETVTVKVLGLNPNGGGTIELPLQKPHARGCALMIANTVLGHPGPQPGFNVRDPRYSGVVRLFAALETRVQRE